MFDWRKAEVRFISSQRHQQSRTSISVIETPRCQAQAARGGRVGAGGRAAGRALADWSPLQSAPPPRAREGQAGGCLALV
jgi:hypothetical protein